MGIDEFLLGLKFSLLSQVIPLKNPFIASVSAPGRLHRQRLGSIILCCAGGNSDSRICCNATIIKVLTARASFSFASLLETSRLSCPNRRLPANGISGAHASHSSFVDEGHLASGVGKGRGKAAYIDRSEGGR